MVTALCRTLPAANSLTLTLRIVRCTNSPLKGRRGKFVDAWQALLDWANAHDGGNFLFRGQGDASPIIPKIARPEYQYRKSKELELFAGFKSRARPFLDVAVNSDWEWLALAQHHGAPTRLTDWTTSPLVAAWFAVTSWPHDGDAIVYALEITRKDLGRIDPATGQVPEGSVFAGPLVPTSGVFLIETSPVSSRITTQRGLFALHGDPQVALGIPSEHTFNILKDSRSNVQDKLMGFGIESSNIFPDLDGLCKSLDWRMRTSKGFSALI